MPYETILYEKRDHIAFISLNRPEKLNALNDRLRQELAAAFEDARRDDGVRVVILTGAGDRAFSAGLDPKDLSAAQTSPAERRESRLRRSDPMEACEKPIIGAINGLAYGGGTELALRCDVRIASEKATFALAEVRRGLIPGSGGTQRLPRAVPRAVAMEMILTGDLIDAQEAFRVGLVSRVVPHEQLMAEAEKVARAICARAPVAVRFAKEAVAKGLEMTLEQGLRLEGDLSALLITTEDAREGPRAFAEQREPVWQGR